MLAQLAGGTGPQEPLPLQSIVATRDAVQFASRFPLPWSAYVRLLAVKDDQARHFYEVEAMRYGWSVRQLDRQVGSQYYERALLSKNKSAMLHAQSSSEPDGGLIPE